MHIVFCLKADMSSALNFKYRLQLSWNVLCLMGTEMKMHFLYSTLMLFYSKLMFMEWGGTSTCLGQANPWLRRAGNIDCLSGLSFGAPCFWKEWSWWWNHRMWLQKVLVLLPALLFICRMNSEVNWSSVGEQLTCSVKHRELMCLFSELTSVCETILRSLDTRDYKSVKLE